MRIRVWAVLLLEKWENEMIYVNKIWWNKYDVNSEIIKRVKYKNSSKGPKYPFEPPNVIFTYSD